MSGAADKSNGSTHGVNASPPLRPSPAGQGRVKGALPGMREWYAEGLRFECTQCGNCCTGPPGYVWFNEEEGRAMAAALSLSEREFFERYARREGRRWSLRERQTEHGYDCIFLDRTAIPGKAICGIYEARPTQCRTWPFWPENLKSESTWRRVKRATPCPGMDRGTLVTIDEIRIQRDRNTK